MSHFRFTYTPLALSASSKRPSRSQVGAICYRMRNDTPEVLLVTTRRRGRWIIPKGWPMDDLTPAEAAATEAYEEAGVAGRVHPLCLGVYSYAKGRTAKRLPCVVALYAVQVDRLLPAYPERDQRKRRWMSTRDAANIVEEPELSSFLAGFQPAGLPPPHSPRHRRR